MRVQFIVFTVNPPPFQLIRPYYPWPPIKLYPVLICPIQCVDHSCVEQHNFPQLVFVKTCYYNVTPNPSHSITL